MARYPLSNGLYIEKSTLDFRISQAKEEKLAKHMEIYGYYFCTTCRNNECKPIDVAHILSVDWCQKNGQSELAYDLNNMVIEGRECHQKRDKLNLNYGKSND